MEIGARNGEKLKYFGVPEVEAANSPSKLFDVGKWFDDFLYFVDIVCSILDTADFAFYVSGARRPSVLDE